MLEMPMKFRRDQLHMDKAKGGVISSLFGPRPALGDFHKGLDIVMPVSSPVYSVMHGRVEYVDTDGSTGAGKYVHVDHGSGVETRYLHLESVVITKGEWIRAGEQVGTMGWTGQVVPQGPRGAHLHFEIIVGGTKVDPLPRLNGDVEVPNDLVAIELDGYTIAWGRLVGNTTFVGENELRFFAGHLQHKIVRWLDHPRVAVLAPKKGVDPTTIELAIGHCETVVQLLKGVLQ